MILFILFLLRCDDYIICDIHFTNSYDYRIKSMDFCRDFSSGYHALYVVLALVQLCYRNAGLFNIDCDVLLAQA